MSFDIIEFIAFDKETGFSKTMKNIHYCLSGWNLLTGYENSNRPIASKVLSALKYHSTVIIFCSRDTFHQF